MEDLDRRIKNAIREFARQISNQPLGLIYHIPESWALVNACYSNVKRNVEMNGGMCRYGWFFYHRFASSFQSCGYIVATHHAVWNIDQKLVDITPFNDNVNYQPMPQNSGSILFLVDDKAKPLDIGGHEAPLPLRFFPVEKVSRLVEYVEMLTAEEKSRCEGIYREIRNLI